jgi:hypothetical protein
MIGQEETRTTAAPATDTFSEPSLSSVADCSSSCHSSTYFLSFLIPFAVVGTLYAPEAMQTQNWGFAAIPALLAGTTALGMYRLCKIIKHRVLKH